MKTKTVSNKRPQHRRCRPIHTGTQSDKYYIYKMADNFKPEEKIQA